MNAQHAKTNKAKLLKNKKDRTRNSKQVAHTCISFIDRIQWNNNFWLWRVQIYRVLAQPARSNGLAVCSLSSNWNCQGTSTTDIVHKTHNKQRRAYGTLHIGARCDQNYDYGQILKMEKIFACMSVEWRVHVMCVRGFFIW